MSHVDAGPLANYSSLLDPNLAGYFSNTRIKKHLRRAGLVTRDGAVVTENEFRLNMARKEHRRQVREMLASAIVNKTLDMERRRQALIRQKLEEIASIELVKRVKAHRKFGYEAAIENMVKLNLVAGDSKPTASSANDISGAEGGSITDQRLPSVHAPSLESINWSQPATVWTPSNRPSSGPPHASRARSGRTESKAIYVPRAQSGSSARKSKVFYDSDTTDDDDGGAETEQLWVTKAWAAATATNKVKSSDHLPTTWQSELSLEQPSPRSERRSVRKVSTDRPRSSYSADRQHDTQRAIRAQDLDYRHLSKLDRYATEKYGLLMDTEDAGRHESPYIENSDLLTPHPPDSRRRDSAASSRPRRRPSTASVTARRPAANIPRDEHGRPISCPKDCEGKLILHRTEPAFKAQEQTQTFCEVAMRFFGSHINLERDGVDPRHEIVVEQQHCGGSTLTVFRALLLPRSNFTFTSRRHSGYPFGLTFYIDGVQDIRLSACCEYKHRRGYRLGGKTGHFGFIRINGSVPCYRCKAEREARVNHPVRKMKPEKKAAVTGGSQSEAELPEPPTAPQVETAVGSGQPAEEEPNSHNDETPENDYDEDFDADDGNKQETVSVADSEHGVASYEENFEEDDVDSETEEIVRAEPLEIAVTNDSDEEQPKDKYYVPKVTKALPVKMSDSADVQQDLSSANAPTSDWRLLVNVSKPDSRISAVDSAKPPPAPSRSTSSTVSGRHAKPRNVGEKSDGPDGRDNREAAGEGSFPSPRSIASDDDVDLYGTIRSSSASSLSSPPPSGRQSPLLRGEKASDVASLEEGVENGSGKGASQQLTPASSPSKQHPAPASESPTVADGDEEISEESGLAAYRNVRSSAQVGGDNVKPSNAAQEEVTATMPAADGTESEAESVASDRLPVHMSKPDSRTSAADAAKPPPAPSRSTSSTVSGRHAKPRNGGEKSDDLDGRDNREAAGEGSFPSPRSIASDDDVDLHGTTRSSSESEAESVASDSDNGYEKPVPALNRNLALGGMPTQDVARSATSLHSEAPSVEVSRDYPRGEMQGKSENGSGEALSAVALDDNATTVAPEDGPKPAVTAERAPMLSVSPAPSAAEAQASRKGDAIGDDGNDSDHNSAGSSGSLTSSFSESNPSDSESEDLADGGTSKELREKQT